MTTVSQNINNSYGYLWCLNGKSNFMLPSSQTIFNSSIIPNTSNDMIIALGSNDQIANTNNSFKNYKMKKILFISLLILTSLFPCNKDETVNKDSIVGKWQFEFAFENDNNVNITDFEKQSTRKYKLDGTFSITNKNNNDADECIIFNIATGTWENIDSGKYKFTNSSFDEVILNVTFTSGRIKTEDHDYQIWKSI